MVSPLRTTWRQNSDIAHVLAHVMPKPDLSEIKDLDGMPFWTCKPEGLLPKRVTLMSSLCSRSNLPVARSIPTTYDSNSSPPVSAWRSILTAG